jgi:hypothetical protein
MRWLMRRLGLIGMVAGYFLHPSRGAKRRARAAALTRRWIRPGVERGMASARRARTRLAAR